MQINIREKFIRDKSIHKHSNRLVKAKFYAFLYGTLYYEVEDSFSRPFSGYILFSIVLEL